MKKIMGLKRTIMFLMTAVILTVMVGLYAYMWDSFFSQTIMTPFYRRGNWMVVGIYALLLYLFTRMYGGYRIGFYRVSEIIYSQVLSLLLVNLISYCQISLIDRHFINAVPLMFVTVLQCFAVVLWALAANRIYFQIYPPRRMALVYSGDQAVSIFGKMNARGEKFNITEVIRFNDNVEEICALSEEYEALVLSGIPTHQRNKIIRYCYQQNRRVYVVPTVSDILLSSSDHIHLFDTPLLLLRNRGFTNENRFAKRALDLILSTAALICASPFMVLIAACIKLYDKGPVLFKQERLTRDGKVFSVYKFRSMIVDAEKDGVARLAAQNDDRITPVGKFIRKVRFDELPQLFNIFLGDMSIVGPRPERPEIAAQYEKVMPEFAFRLKVKAGLTGYAQILGKYNTTPKDKLLLDLMYIERYSLMLDLKLILMTVKILFLPESTEGIAEGTALPDEVVFVKHDHPEGEPNETEPLHR